MVISGLPLTSICTCPIPSEFPQQFPLQIYVLNVFFFKAAKSIYHNFYMHVHRQAHFSALKFLCHYPHDIIYRDLYQEIEILKIFFFVVSLLLPVYLIVPSFNPYYEKKGKKWKMLSFSEHIRILSFILR